MALEQALTQLPEVDRAGIAQLLNGLGMLGFQRQGRRTREADGHRPDDLGGAGHR
ncbi:MAG: hypothetical protein WD794_05665 [Mycobacteriales bacterium]